MPNTTSKKKTSKRKKSISPRTVALSPTFSIASSNISSISELSEVILNNPNSEPLDPDRETMKRKVKDVKPIEIQEAFKKFKTAGKKNKRKTMKKKKSRRPAKK